jgi:hypothetical protein
MDITSVAVSAEWQSIPGFKGVSIETNHAGLVMKRSILLSRFDRDGRAETVQILIGSSEFEREIEFIKTRAKLALYKDRIIKLKSLGITKGSYFKDDMNKSLDSLTVEERAAVTGLSDQFRAFLRQHSPEQKESSPLESGEEPHTPDRGRDNSASADSKQPAKGVDNDGVIQLLTKLQEMLAAQSIEVSKLSSENREIRAQISGKSPNQSWADAQDEEPPA